MPAKLLIICENGRTVKTYGLTRLDNYNMKFTFLCIVIVISCSVCASGDLEIYPGLKFDLSPEAQRRRLESAAEDSYGEIYRRRPWRNLDDYNTRTKDQEYELAQRLRNFQELLDRNREKNTDEDELPYYYNPRVSFENVYEEFNRNMDKARKHERYSFQYPVLDDVRPYPQEDDFTFGEEEEEEPSPKQGINKKVRSDSHHHREVEEDKESEEASGKSALKDVKFVEDPSQFAYPPTDARYFQNTDSDATEEIIQQQTTVYEQSKDNKIHLKHRSDENFSQEVDEADEIPRDANHMEVVAVRPSVPNSESAGVYIIAVVAGISAAATVGLIAVGIGWYNLQKHVKNASDVEYPAYGVTGPNKDASPSGDRRLAQSAQMYHYQHQKQQIIAMESRAAAGDRHGSVSEAESDEENEEGDYTVYECPGLAPTGEMEVKNPLFQDDPTPAQTPPVKPNGDEKK